MTFANRAEAGRELAKRLAKYAGRDDVIVLAAPRGGVPIAFEVASALRAPMDVFVVRKLGVPGYEELAFGSVASGNVRVLDWSTIRQLELSDADIERVSEVEMEEVKRQEALYRGQRPVVDIRGMTVILVDDGIATGASMRAVIQALRQMEPAAIIVATPVASASSLERLQPEVDDLVCLAALSTFRSVGEFYEDFRQVTDDEVIALLERSRYVAS